MPTLTPVDHDPFAGALNLANPDDRNKAILDVFDSAGTKLTPVDHDPFASVGTQAMPEDTGFISRVGGDILNRANEGADAIVAYRNDDQGLGQTAIQLAGKMGAGTIIDVLGEAAKSAYTSLPDAAQQFIGDKAKDAGSYLADTIPGQLAIEGAKRAGNLYSRFSNEDPNAARSIESAANIASLFPIGKGTSIGANAAADAGPPVIRAFDKISNLESTNLSRGILNNASGVSPNAATLGMQDAIGNFGKGLTARGGDALDASTKVLHNKSSALFKQIDDSGVGINRNTAISAVKRIYDDLSKDGISPNSKLSQREHGSTLAALEDLQADIKAGKTSLSTLFGYRSQLGKIAQNTMDGKPTQDAFAARRAQESLDEVMEGFSGTDFKGKGGMKTMSLGREAIDQWKQYRKFDNIATILKNADGEQAKIKAGLNRLLNSKRSKAFDIKEKMALKAAAKNSTPENLGRALGTFGFDFGGRKNVALPGLMAANAAKGSVAAFIPHGILLTAAGTVAKQATKYAARGKAENLLQIIEGTR